MSTNLRLRRAVVQCALLVSLRARVLLLEPPRSRLAVVPRAPR